MMFFDSHCHLQDERILAQAGAIVARAQGAGVTRMLCCGTREADWEAVKILAVQYPAIVPAFGYHPWFIKERSKLWLEKLEALLAAVPGAAIGEIGLDHAFDKRNDEEQTDAFLAQIKLARKLRRPVSVHCRKAWGDLLKILEGQCGLPNGGVIHSYSGPPDLIARLDALNVSLSFSGSITHNRNVRGRASAAAVPDHRLLIETDAPDSPPLGVAQGANEPAQCAGIAREIAALRGTTAERIAEITYENAARLF